VYYNGSTWVNTGHAAMAVNMGGAGPYIYTYNGGTGQIYKYNGTGPATLLITLPGGLGPYDVTGDASGNFYVMKTNALPHTLSQYSPTGTLLTTYSMIGFPSGSAGGGFAFIGGKLYADISGTRVWGTISGTTITYGGVLTLSTSPGDLANWPLPIVPLPVELLSFNGSYNESIRKNSISWTTSAELNNDYFTLEFSENGYEWNWLTDISGAGNSNSAVNYSTDHDSPFKTTYYRLKQTDYDGGFKYYDPITVVRPESETSIHLYPNPATHVLNIVAEQTIESYQISDETGKIVMQGSGQTDIHQLDISSIENGLYFFTTITNGEVNNSRFIKN
jgi:hypothetical protein